MPRPETRGHKSAAGTPLMPGQQHKSAAGMPVAGTPLVLEPWSNSAGMLVSHNSPEPHNSAGLLVSHNSPGPQNSSGLLVAGAPLPEQLHASVADTQLVDRPLGWARRLQAQ